MKAVRVVIRKYVDPAAPGWVPASPYPQAGVIACEVLETRQDAEGRDLATMSTVKPWGVESAEGRAEFEVFSEQLLEF
jgi:hypothetical protein